MPRQKVLTHERFARTPAPDNAQREVSAVREILHTYLRADRPEEVFQFALDRISPLIGASFASIYLVEGVSELMRLAAAYNWPAKYRPWLSEMRVRIGFGPSGEAVSERRMIEVPDVAADIGLEDWAEVATELGFRSLVALPLQDALGALGAVTFYFTEVGAPSPECRNLMRLVADLMSATAEKVNAVDELRRVTAALSDARAEQDRQLAVAVAARRRTDEFFAGAAEHFGTPLEVLSTALTSPGGGAQLAMARRAAAVLHWGYEELLDYAAPRDAAPVVQVESLEVSAVVEAARRLLEDRGLAILSHVEPVPAGTPRVRGDRRKAARALASLAMTAWRHVPAPIVIQRCEVAGGRVRLFVEATSDVDAHAAAEPNSEGSIIGGVSGSRIGRALASQLARLGGGDVDVVLETAQAATYVLDLPVDGAEVG